MATVAERIELLHNNLAHVEAMGGEKKLKTACKRQTDSPRKTCSSV